MDRPQTTHGHTKVIKTGCGKLYLTEASADSYQEVFTKLGKSGGCAASFLDGVGRLITFALNAGVPKDTIIQAFMGIQCPSPMWSNGVQVLSCLDGIAKLLKEEKDNEDQTPIQPSPSSSD